MSKNFSVDRKGEGASGGEVGDTQVIPRMITSQASTPGLPLTRPALALQTPAQQTFIVQPHHDMKNFAKSTRPIAPAPPSQTFSNLSARTVSQTNNIPSIITPSLGHATSGSESTVAVGHTPISVPVTLSQASVLTLANPSSLGSTATIVQQGLPINMLRAPLTQQPQSQIQALQNLTHLNRGTSTLPVPKSAALLRQPTSSPTLQVPGVLPPALSLPLARAPVLQSVKTTIAQVARPLSPAVGSQAHDLSRSSFSSHGPITQTLQGSHAMHITLNPRMATPQVVAGSITQQHLGDNTSSNANTRAPQLVVPAIAATTGSSINSAAPPQVIPPSSSSTPLALFTSTKNSDPAAQHRLGGVASLNQEHPTGGAVQSGVHHHIHHPLNNPHHSHSQQQQPVQQLSRSSTLPFSGPVSNKLAAPHQGLVQPAKVIPSHALQQQVPPSIKSVNLAVPSPVMINSINPAAIPSCIASSIAPIPIAKVPPQRHHLAGGIPLVSAAPHLHPAQQQSLQPPSSSAALNLTPTASSVSTLPTAMAISSLPTSLPMPMSSSSSSSASLASMGPNLVDSGSGRQEHAGLSMTQSSNGGIIITPDFQGRASVIPVTSMVTSSHAGTAPVVVSHADNRQQIGISPEDSMWYQHIVYQHVSQSSLVTQPGGPTIVRPGPNAFAFLPAQGKVQGQTSLTALPASSAPPGMRFGAATVAPVAGAGTMMVVDPLRQQQHHHHPTGVAMHPAYSGASIHGGLIADKLASLSSRPNTGVPGGGGYTASVGVQSAGPQHMASLQSSGLSAVPVSNPSSSPRPSILRKRTSDMAGVMVRKPNFNLNQDHRCHSPPRVDPPPATTTTSHTNNTAITASSSPTPKISTKNFSPMSENSQSSTDTALSSNDATTPTNNHTDKAKGDADDCVENGTNQNSTINNIPASPAVSHTGSLSEASPRKRARKQSLHANEELKDENSSSDEDLEASPHKKRDDTSKEQRQKEKEIEKRGEYLDEDGVRWVLDKPKPMFVLLQPDIINSKTRNNHFVRYGDVKPKEDRRPTVNELSNQKGIMQKVNGWKLYFSASQLEELMDFEKEMRTQFMDVQGDLAKVSTYRPGSEETLKIHEISQANIQRCELIQSQLTEARAAMLRTLDHQPRIHQIVNKHMSKRPIKKKERS